MAGSSRSSQHCVSVVSDTIIFSFSLARKISAGIALGLALTVSSYPVYSYPLLVAKCLQDEDKGCNPQVLLRGRTRALLQSPFYAGFDTYEDRSSGSNKLSPFGISLEQLLPEWQILLQGWAKDGSLAQAAEEALGLAATPAALEGIVGQLSSGNFKALPPIVLLSGSRISGVKGAYASSTGTIYLNANWLKNASKQQVFSVLTEELGHHLDRVMNASDTPGDEGEYFARILANRSNGLTALEIQALRAQKDEGYLVASGQVLQVEFALNYWWNDWGGTTGIGIKPQHYDLSSNTLFVLEADYWDAQGPKGFTLAGRNADNGALYSRFAIDDNPGLTSFRLANLPQIAQLSSGNWVVAGLRHLSSGSISYTEMRGSDGSLIWRTEGAGGRYEMSSKMVVSSNEQYAYLPAGSDGNGDGAFGSGIAKINLSDGSIVKIVNQIPGGGSGFHFFEGHGDNVLVDTATGVLVLDQDLDLVGQLTRPFLHGGSPYLQARISNILPINDGGYILTGQRDIADLYDPAFLGSQTVYAFAAGYSGNSVANNLTQADWLIDLASQGRNIHVRDAQFLPDGTIGIVGTTGWGHDGSSWLGGITTAGTQTYNELFAGVRASEGFFVDQAGDIRAWEARGINGANSGTYTIDISSTSSPPLGDDVTSGGGTGSSGGSSTGGAGDSSTSGTSAASVPGPLPLLGLGVAFAWSRRLRNKYRSAAQYGARHH